MSNAIVFPCSRPNWESVKGALQELKTGCPLIPIEKAFETLSEAYEVLTDEDEDDSPPIAPIYEGLRHFLKEVVYDNVFLVDTLPSVIELVLAHESLLPDPPLSVVNEQSEETVTLSRHLVASIIACGFLGYFTDSGLQGARDIDFNFVGIWSDDSASNIAKLHMIFEYFRRWRHSVPEGNITIRRLVLHKDKLLSEQDLRTSTRDLCAFVVKEEGSIEDAGKNVLQVDFANEYIGGGVLHGGNVQEEIRFSICPELLSSILIMAPMADNEAIILEGFEQFSLYKGYGGSLSFTQSCDDSKSKGKDGQFLTTLCAIDATCYSAASPLPQYKIPEILRDLNKAYIGFSQPYLPDWEEPPETTDPDWVFSLDPMKKRVIATGNWGCGIFGGDPQLKAVIQWLAATLAKCPALVYYTFEDERMYELAEIVNFIQQKHWTVRDLTEVMLKYCATIKAKKRVEQTFFEYILDEYTGEES